MKILSTSVSLAFLCCFGPAVASPLQDGSPGKTPGAAPATRPGEGIPRTGAATNGGATHQPGTPQPPAGTVPVGTVIPRPVPGDGVLPPEGVAPPAHRLPQGPGPVPIPQIDPTRVNDYQKNQKWFKKLDLDLGTHFQEASAKGFFEFQNPTGKEQKIVNLLPSCGCTNIGMEIDGKLVAVAKPFVGEVVVPPARPCKLTVEIDLKGVVGQKSGDIRVQTTDPETPFVTLHATATAKVFFQAVPESVHLGELHYSDRREFGPITVTSPYAKKWNIIGKEGIPARMTINLKKIEKEDSTSYEITGVYGPGLEEGSGGGTLKFVTDVENRSFTVNVSGFVVGPLQMTPGYFISFGHVPFGTSKKMDVEFLCKDPSHKLKIEKVEWYDLQSSTDEPLKPEYFAHEVKELDDGKKVILTLTVKENAPRCQGRGKIRVTLNHPQVKPREMQFNVFIR